jgi:hypothetical protein
MQLRKNDRFSKSDPCVALYVATAESAAAVATGGKPSYSYVGQTETLQNIHE